MEPTATSVRRRSLPVESDVVLASLLRWLLAARVAVLIAGGGALVMGAALLARGRRLEGLTLGLFGLAAAVTARAVLGYISWSVRATSERDRRRRRPVDPVPS